MLEKARSRKAAGGTWCTTPAPTATALARSAAPRSTSSGTFPNPTGVRSRTIPDSSVSTGGTFCGESSGNRGDDALRVDLSHAGNPKGGVRDEEVARCIHRQSRREKLGLGGQAAVADVRPAARHGGYDAAGRNLANQPPRRDVEISGGIDGYVVRGVTKACSSSCAPVSGAGQKMRVRASCRGGDGVALRQAGSRSENGGNSQKKDKGIPRTSVHKVLLW